MSCLLFSFSLTMLYSLRHACCLSLSHWSPTVSISCLSLLLRCTKLSELHVDASGACISDLFYSFIYFLYITFYHYWMWSLDNRWRWMHSVVLAATHKFLSCDTHLRECYPSYFPWYEATKRKLRLAGDQWVTMVFNTVTGIWTCTSYTNHKLPVVFPSSFTILLSRFFLDHYIFAFIFS